MTDEEKIAAEAEAKAKAEAEEAEFEASLEGLSEEEKAEKIAEKEASQMSPEEKAKELLRGEKRILVDKDRFNDRNDKAKLYETFAPLIDKIKDKPELVEELLEIKKKGSLEERVLQMEEERKTEKRRELTVAVTDALSKWQGFEKDWPEIQDQVENLFKRGLPFKEAIRRSYLALHPEEAENEAKRIAQENVNAEGIYSSSFSRAPQTYKEKKETKLNEREKKVAQDLLGKDFGGGFIPIKSEEDYARLLEKHKDHLRAKGFYDLP